MVLGNALVHLCQARDMFLFCLSTGWYRALLPSQPCGSMDQLLTGIK